jgi:hypothetical protein
MWREETVSVANGRLSAYVSLSLKDEPWPPFERPPIVDSVRQRVAPTATYTCEITRWWDHLASEPQNCMPGLCKPRTNVISWILRMVPRLKQPIARLRCCGRSMAACQTCRVCYGAQARVGSAVSAVEEGWR